MLHIGLGVEKPVSELTPFHRCKSSCATRCRTPSTDQWEAADWTRQMMLPKCRSLLQRVI